MSVLYYVKQKQVGPWNKVLPEVPWKLKTTLELSTNPNDVVEVASICRQSSSPLDSITAMFLNVQFLNCVKEYPLSRNVAKISRYNPTDSTVNCSLIICISELITRLERHLVEGVE